MTQTVPSDAHPTPLQRLLAALTLSTAGTDTFAAHSIPMPSGRVYGGQVLAQALLAAGATMAPGRLPHSLHGYFLRPGAVNQTVTLSVERLNDGRSFSARRTHASQDGTTILSMIASFQEEQPGIDLTSTMPQLPGPEDVPSAVDLLGTIDHPVAQFWSHHTPFDLRHVNGALYLGPSEPQPHQAVWMRTRGPVPDNQLLHRAMMAYACDQVMLEPILRAAGESWATPGLSVASLDHAMWWHRDARVDDWLLYVQSTASAQGGRGLGTARVFDRDGRLVASIAQEGMIRVPVAASS